MTLSLQNDQKQQLDYIISQPNEGLSNCVLCCLVSVSNLILIIPVLNNCLSIISCGKVLISINDATDDIKLKAPRALLKLLLDSKKLRLSEKDFNAQVKQLTGATNDTVDILWRFINEDETLETLVTIDEYKFRDLEWRLEAKVTTRDYTTS